MFIPNSVSFLILSFALCSNAMNFTLEKVNNACNYENALVDLAGNLTLEGTRQLLTAFLNNDVSMVGTLVQKICQDPKSLYNTIGHQLPQNVFDGISLVAGCTNKMVAYSYTNCQRFQQCWHFFSNTTGNVHQTFDTVKSQLVRYKIAAFDTITIPMLKKLKVTLAKENQATVNGIISYYHKIMNILRTLVQ